MVLRNITAKTARRIAATQTEVRLVFRRPPNLGFAAFGVRRPEQDQFVVKLDPTTGAQVQVEAKRGDDIDPEPILLDIEFAEQGGEGATPYEVLLRAALAGNSVRFTRQDGVEEQWRIMQPLLDNSLPVHSYAKGSWGPKEADELVARYGGWHGPWVTP